MGAVVKWALPVATLVLIPKCPACFAGYVLLFTGVGISFGAAAVMRWALIAVCVSAVGWLLLRAVQRAWRCGTLGGVGAPPAPQSS